MKPRNRSTKNSQFSIDMDLKGLVAFLVLVALTGSTLFYLGMTYGKASRNPNRPVQREGGSSLVKDLNPPKDLKIYDIGAGSSGSLQEQFESLKSSSESVLSEETKALRSREVEQKALEQSAQKLQVEPTEPKRQNKGVAKSPKAKVSWPDIVKETTRERPKEILYTVQIFSTSQESKANRMVHSLKQKGFPAYIAKIRLEGRQLYRVRVAKASRDKVETFKGRLNKVVQGVGNMRVMRLR